MTRRPEPADVLAILQHHADNGMRCPTNDQLRGMLQQQGFSGMPKSCHPATLAREGHLRVEVYRLNWRVIEIGGRRTAECPHKAAAPYVVITREPPPEMRRAALELPPHRIR